MLFCSFIKTDIFIL